MTRAELTTYVLERLSIASSDTARVAQIQGQLNREYQRIARAEELIVSSATLGVTAGSPLVTLPADFASALTVRRSDTVLRPVTRVRMAELVAGLPEDAEEEGAWLYAFQGPSSLRLYPTPETTDAAALELIYVARPADMTIDADTPSALPAEFHDLIAELTIERIALAEEEPGLAQAARLVAEGIRQELREAINERPGPARSHIYVRGFPPR